MKAWIARDVTGVRFYFSEPEYWEEVGRFFPGQGYVFRVLSESDLETMGTSVELGCKQPIELTAKPLGPAVKGGE